MKFTRLAAFAAALALLGFPAAAWAAPPAFNPNPAMAGAMIQVTWECTVEGAVGATVSSGGVLPGLEAAAQPASADLQTQVNPAAAAGDHIVLVQCLNYSGAPVETLTGVLTVIAPLPSQVPSGGAGTGGGGSLGGGGSMAAGVVALTVAGLTAAALIRKRRS